MADSEITRILYFRTNDLGKESNFVLTFDENIPGIYKDVFPTVFQVAMFGARYGYEFRLVYKSKLGFTRAEIFDDNTVYASTYTHINIGEETTLTKSGTPPVYGFSAAKTIAPPTTQMIAQNSTDSKQNIGIGFFDQDQGEPSQVLVFTDVGAGSRVQTEFTPILRGYVTPDYKQNAILKAQIGTPVLFKENLVNLEQKTYWHLFYNPGSGKYEIKRDEH